MRTFFYPLIFFLFFVSTPGLYGQNGTTPPNLIPPSPEATSLFKFVETPVDLSSGLANINIPLYTIKTKGVEIPIALSYHSRGIQVGELASRVGLGWTLQQGGMVSRQTRGKSDDGESGGYLKSSFYSNFFTSESTRNSTYQSYVNNAVDFDPDKFFFSFPGYSGKFIFDQVTKAPWQKKYSNIKIEPLRNHVTDIIKGFKITDEKGNIYYFGALSSSTSLTDVIGDKEIAPGKWIKNNGDQGLMPATASSDGFTSWHLLKIETYYNEVITFTYSSEDPTYIRKSYDENIYNDPSGATAISYYSEVNSTQYQLSKIDFPGGKVVFNSNSATREDLPGTYSLANIEVFNNNNKSIKKYLFDYEVVISDTNGNYISSLASTDSSTSKRMFLKTVTETDGRNENPPYEFIYSSVKLPNRLSSSQDNWGYFNGANNGPFMPFFDYGNYTMDRRVDPAKNGAGLLQKVIYPTGGYALYEYEQNLCIKPFFLDQTVSPGNNPEVFKNAFLGHLMKVEGNDYWDENSNIFRMPVIIGENKSSTVTSYVDFDFYYPADGPCQNYESTAECNFSMVLDGGNGNSYILRFGNNISMSGVPAGNYELKVYPPGGDSSISFTAELRWYEEEPIEDALGNPLMVASGKRIKKITYSEGQSQAKVKEYKYDFPDGANSGKIFGYPNFYAIKESADNLNIVWKYGSTPGSPLTSLQSNDLSYGYVTEFEGTESTNIGKTEYEFTNFSDGGTYYEFPYHIPVDNQWLRGKLLKTKVFAKSGSLFSLVKEVENVYQYGGISGPQPANVGAEPLVGVDVTAERLFNEEYYQLPLAIFTPDDDQPDGHSYKIYYQRGGAFDLHSTTETSYLKNEQGDQQVISSTTHNYDYPNHYQLKGSSTIAHGQTTATTYSYPYQGAGANVDSLFHKNRWIPTETVTTVKEGSTLVAETKQKTLFEPSSDGIILPSVIQSAKKGDPYQSRVEFPKYDSVGNPLEVKQTGGPTTVYIWGYDKQYPVAKIENSSYTTVEGLPYFSPGFDLGGNGLSENQKIQLRGLSGALVTTYDYDPLIGMTVVTDANGKTTTYVYDPFNQLKEVYNQDGHIIKQINYHFKTTN